VTSTLLFGDFGDGKEGDLHTLQKTDNRHEQEKENNSEPSWNTLPHGGLSLEKSFKSNGERKAENSQ